MEFTDDGVVIDKPLSELDELVVDVVDTLERVGVDYVVVSGYVAVLFGRSRATEDIDVITERFDERVATRLSDELRERGYWGSAMPLDSLFETLSDDLPLRVAEHGHRVPNVELKFASDEYDRTSLRNTIQVSLRGTEITVGSLEFQIAYKLSMGAQKDFEDALYLYEVAGNSLNTRQLEGYVETLGVEEEYDKLRS
ncbi:hypothetical protein I7X12_01890 [Halosimplex litoreum]|uniref:Nucleotidyl transferase AbiEii toxin, Type IV TA system n=1 Tax=Halosimplex litoreum TaxID=1198301 RepID=A0A7T3FZF3_9EURY|nr:hypothetical protein [Halosimplex litoreum]QPV63412.1 hypothetical protein I7X12_01890 [Halosimplex litoreum]